MPAVKKNRAVNQFRSELEQLRTDLLDPTKNFSVEEMTTKKDAMAALNMRLQIAGEMTVDDTLEERSEEDGENIPAELRREAPDSREPIVTGYKQDIEALTRRIEKEFGGPNSLILALARKSEVPMSSRQRDVIAAIDALQKRVFVGTEGDAGGGEFLLPLQQVASIFSVDVSVGGIADVATRYNVAGRTLRIPYVVQTDATGGVTRPMAGIAQVTIVGEGAEKPEREVKFLQRLLTVYKWAAYTEIADEILADDMTGQLAPTIQRLIGGQVMNAINESATIDGDGTGDMLGAFHPNNGSLLVIPRENANDFTVTDAFNTFAQHMVGPKSRWFMSPSVIPKLAALTLGSNTLVTWMGSLTNGFPATLLGIPITFTPIMPILGTQGDVALGNGEYYALALRQALTIQSSIHYKFRNDITAYRFFARAGGLPIPDGTYAYKAPGGTKEWEMSPFVVLDDLEAS